MTSYFYVSKIGGGKPSYQHPSFESAMTEAQRLIDEIGGEYEILEVRAIVKAMPKYVVQDFGPNGLTDILTRNYNHDDETCPF